jgi:hypothetical protein
MKSHPLTHIIDGTKQGETVFPAYKPQLFKLIQILPHRYLGYRKNVRKGSYFHPLISRQSL